ncbi:MAG: hypothetical protein PW999_10075 [Paraburkholderia tropica]|nr:hypothetical protein [Paraburkholderia tropica]
MTAIAKVCSALLGTSGTVNGLACTPTSPATMTVQIGAGEIYQLENLEATACGTLPANTTYQILKQGIQFGTYTTSAFATPSTSGQSINYLIEAQYQDSDISLDPTTGTTPVVLQFYNSTTPSSPWSGPNNSGATSNTFRDGIVAYTIKAGVAATTGSQVTPSPDTGWIGLWVVTVPYGATSLTSSNISQYTGSPILPTGILQSIITSNLTYGVDSGTAGIVQAKFPIPVTTLVDGMDVWVKIAATNTSTATFTPNPGVISAAPIVGAAHAALQGGELVVGGRANLVWRADITSWVLVECTGGAQQVAPATASQHAMQLGQATGRLLAITPFTGSGTWTPNALTKSWRLRMVGAGGGSGGTGATSSTQSSISQSAAGGSFCEAWFTTVPTTATITIGAAGAAGASTPGNGGAGGNSTLTASGISVTCPGGTGGTLGGPYGGVQVNTGAVGPAPCTVTGAAQIVQSVTGQAGGVSTVISNAASMVTAGAGGSSMMGLGGTISAVSGYGSGAPARTAGISSAALAGYAGSQGYAVIEEYC